MGRLAYMWSVDDPNAVAQRMTVVIVQCDAQKTKGWLKVWPTTCQLAHVFAHLSADTAVWCVAVSVQVWAQVSLAHYSLSTPLNHSWNPEIHLPSHMWDAVCCLKWHASLLGTHGSYCSHQSQMSWNINKCQRIARDHDRHKGSLAHPNTYASHKNKAKTMTW